MELRHYTKLSKADLIQRIEKAKIEKNIRILAHNYQRPEVQEVADYLGDSLDLATKAQALNCQSVLLCGVLFMAETAKILNPELRVLIPDLNATCQLADTISIEELHQAKEEHPDAVVVSYVNTSALVKAASDLCCTSANAAHVVNSIPPGREILFVPDRNLGKWVADCTGRHLILWNGFCYVHEYMTEADVETAKTEHPQAKLVVHPECTPRVAHHAHLITSTNGMVHFANEAEELIVGTEIGLIERLKREYPLKKFHPLCASAICATMKLITLDKVCWALENDQYPVELNPEVIAMARSAIEKMIALRGITNPPSKR
ncbi:hypothetical protein AMJ40_02200 [candidate division TA06 bacterium DG_26]|uniref:Quinolinate synthase n=1 Tax=candidate division TA06 bacterium DG_26 TaxID=1703771 RepID=A0A0S7WKJ6_UNCT6|nr:MAG: hypothetical protein AMJ40_02200 [candidate division TA06 bacterium DG_26]